MLALSGFAEHRVEDSTFLVDVSARFSPLRFLSLAGSVGRSSATRTGDRPTTLAYRGEAGVRLGRTWLSGGVMSIDTSRVPAPLVYDTTFLSVDAGSRTGTFVSVRGPVWESVGLDVTATRWTKNQPYLPDMQVRSEVYFRTNWLSKFPQGNFGIQASVAYEYRTRVWFPRSSSPTASFR